MSTKALVLDIDGALTNDRGEMSEAAKAAIRKLLQSGHKAIFTSGRPTPGMRKIEQELELDRYGSYLFAYNGAKIVECRSGEIVFQRTLAPTYIPRLYNFAKEHGCGLITYLSSEIISAFQPDEYIELEGSVNNLPVRQVVNFPRYMEYAFHKCMMTAPSERAEELEKILQEKFGTNLNIYRSQPFFVEIMPKNVEKAATLAEMLRIIGFNHEDTISCEDENMLLQVAEQLS